MKPPPESKKNGIRIAKAMKIAAITFASLKRPTLPLRA